MSETPEQVKLWPYMLAGLVLLALVVLGIACAESFDDFYKIL